MIHTYIHSSSVSYIGGPTTRYICCLTGYLPTGSFCSDGPCSCPCSSVLDATTQQSSEPRSSTGTAVSLKRPTQHIDLHLYSQVKAQPCGRRVSYLIVLGKAENSNLSPSGLVGYFLCRFGDSRQQSCGDSLVQQPVGYCNTAIVYGPCVCPKSESHLHT